MTMISPTAPMEQHCNLELCLSPPSSSSAAESTTSTSGHHHIVNYHPGFPVTDLTELQARAIIIGATRQMEERKSTCRTRLSVEEKSAVETSTSMRRSLQRFLQKRKHRVQTLSPYAHL